MKLKFFRADWCNPCRQMDPIVQSIMDEDGFRDRYSLERIDVDTEPEISAKWGVRGVPTFVITDDQGKELARRIGATPRNKMREWLIDAPNSWVLATAHPLTDCMFCELPAEPGNSNAVSLFLKNIWQKIKAFLALDNTGVNNK